MVLERMPDLDRLDQICAGDRCNKEDTKSPAPDLDRIDLDTKLAGEDTDAWTIDHARWRTC